MNPVDHVCPSTLAASVPANHVYSLTVVGIINTLAKHRQFRGTLHRVKRQVLLQLVGLACYVVPRRPRSRDDWSCTELDCACMHRVFVDQFKISRSVLSRVIAMGRPT